MNTLKHGLRQHICGTDKEFAATLQIAGFCTRQWEADSRERVMAQVRPWWKFWRNQ
jgi:hypothetical protein